MLFHLFTGWTWEGTEQILTLTMGVFILCAWLIKKGHYRYAVTLFVTTITVLACSLIYVTDGLHDEATVILPAVLLFACMFGSKRQFYLLLAGLIGFLGYITVAHQMGWHVLADRNGTDLSAFINVSVILTASGFFAFALASDLHNALSDLNNSKKDLLELNDQLESRVEQRTGEIEATNQALHESMDKLEQAMKELMHAEKLASLGSMVAGISHELNTPIGNTMLAASTMERLFEAARVQFESGTFKRMAMEEFLKEGLEMSSLITRSTQRAAEMVASFKQVAVDQTSEQRRMFDLKAVIDDNVSAMTPNFKKKQITIFNKVTAGIRCDSFPGPLGQILTNVIQNAILHGFEAKGGGNLTISCIEQSKLVVLSIHDDGVGMPQHVVAHVFDPFFTTRMGQGGSGLGMSISHRIATSVLGGDLRVESSPGKGTTFTLMLPKIAPFPI
jgi:signal transduction histidine kinase